MQQKSRNQTIISVVVLLLVGAFFIFNHFSGGNTSGSEKANASSTSAASVKSSSSASAQSSATPKAPGKTATSSAAAASAKNVFTGANPSDLPEIKESALPAEGKETLGLIRSGGPYPFDRDNINFGNFEGVLPKQASGFYKEYTVETPGSKTRGAKRIVAGKSGAKYYTSDHYATFKFIVEGK